MSDYWVYIERKFDNAIISIPVSKANGGSVAQKLAYCKIYLNQRRRQLPFSGRTICPTDGADKICTVCKVNWQNNPSSDHLGAGIVTTLWVI